MYPRTVHSVRAAISAWNKVTYLPNLLLTQAFGFALYISVRVPVVRILPHNRFLETLIKHCTRHWRAFWFVEILLNNSL